MSEVRIEIRDTSNSVTGNIDIKDSASFPLSLTYSNFDVRDLASRKGSFSKTFKIPATKENNDIFDHLYFDGFVDTKNIKGRKPATIYVDNLPILTGQLQVTKVIKSDIPEEYECVFFGDNMGWASDVKDADLRDLSLGTEVHNNPRDTFTEDYDDGNTIVYPLCSNGEGDNTDNGVADSDFIPHIFVKRVWDKIFSSVSNGYAVVSTFCDSDFFKSLVMPLNFERDNDAMDAASGKGFLIADENPLGTSSFYYNTTSAHDTLMANRFASFPQGSDDLDGSIDEVSYWTRAFWFRADQQEDGAEVGSSINSTGTIRQPSSISDYPCRFRAIKDGSYTIDVNIELHVEPTTGSWSPADTKIDFELWVELWKTDVGGVSTEKIVDIGDDGDIGRVQYELDRDELRNEDDNGVYQGHVSSHSASIDVNALNGEHYGALIFVKLNSWGSGNTGSFKLTVKAGSSLEGKASPTVTLGESYDVNKMLPSKKQSDFIKGVAGLANLQFHTDAASRQVFVEPYDHFFHPKSQALDWSDKIDTMKGVSDEFIHDIKKNITVSYADGDNITDRFEKKNGYQFGSYEATDTTGTFYDGDFEIKNQFFQPTFMIYEGDYVQSDVSKAPLTPVYWDNYSSVTPSLFHERPDKTFDTGSRVLIYKKEVFTSGHGFDSVGTTLGGSPTFYSTYGRAVFTDWDKPTTTINDGFQDVNLNLAYTSYTSGSDTIHGLYKNYYSKMVEQLKQRPRIKTAYFRLLPTDVMNFDFRSLVYIKGLYYRVNKIVDYKPHRNESTKVELIEFTETGSGTINTNTDTFQM